MRVLIADRDARVLQAVCNRFAREFAIHTATSLRGCYDWLSRDAFDLAIVSEKLADGSGLRLLGRITRESPNTLRVFAAAPAHLERLGDVPGRFGLFRLLHYPFEPRQLLSALTLARAGLQIEQLAPTPAPAARATRPTERVRLNTQDAAIVVNVPKMMAGALQAQRAQQVTAAPPQQRPTAPPRQRAPIQPPRQPKAPPRQQPATAPPQQRGQPSRPLTASPRQQLTAPLPQGLRAPARRQPEARRDQHRAHRPPPAQPARKTPLVLGVTFTAVLLVALLNQTPVDPPAGAQATLHRVEPSAPTPAPWPAPAMQPTPPPTAKLPEPGEPKMDAPQPEAAADNTATIADPSTFGSEAYEPIYTQ